MLAIKSRCFKHGPKRFSGAEGSSSIWQLAVNITITIVQLLVNFYTMFSSPILRAALPNGMLFDFENNPYKAKKEWPPDFSKLSPKHQFRFERRYRRRAKLAWARPVWTKGTKLAQWGLTVFVLGYGVLYMDWGQTDKNDPPFKAVSIG
jgi:hypothetical protein